jgi:hypothetical protein
MESVMIGGKPEEVSQVYGASDANFNAARGRSFRNRTDELC